MIFFALRHINERHDRKIAGMRVEEATAAALKKRLFTCAMKDIKEPREYFVIKNAFSLKVTLGMLRCNQAARINSPSLPIKPVE